MRIATSFCLCLLSFPALPAQETEEQPDFDKAARELSSWFSQYKVGAIRLAKGGLVVPTEVARARRLLGTVADFDDLRAAQALFAIATAKIEPPGTSTSSSDKAAFFSELRVNQVRGMAREMITGMKNEAVETWLLGVAQKQQGKDFENVATEAGAALRILAGRPGPRAKEALLRGCRSMKPEVRVQAINALSLAATLELVPELLALAVDKEPYARIACFNGLGRALGPHTDETEHDQIAPEVAALRDKAIEKMRSAILRDRVWQVRAAARENLALLKSKKVIPVLIDALKAELGRTKDPWSLDIRLHRALEGLTGIKTPVGQVRTWEEFWRKEGASFKFAPAGTKVGQPGAKSDQYQKFFNLELYSNRVMFIVDFSGSMVEPITLKTLGVGTAAGGSSRTTTKAKLVVEELKKMVMTLKDGDLFNIIVFSDDVRIWRPDKDGRPALVKMDDQLRDDLLGSYLDNLQPAGMTNLYGALKAALGVGGRGLHDKYYELGYDTLYILSDGAPTAGEITETDEILRVVRETNALRRLSINAITFGNLNQLVFLKKLAEQNGGRHIHIE